MVRNPYRTLTGPATSALQTSAQREICLNERISLKSSTENHTETDRRTLAGFREVILERICIKQEIVELFRFLSCCRILEFWLQSRPDGNGRALECRRIRREMAASCVPWTTGIFCREQNMKLPCKLDQGLPRLRLHVLGVDYRPASSRQPLPPGTRFAIYAAC